jgi:DNA repair protein RecN (Recombination protein N)
MKTTSSFLLFGSDELTFLFNANLGGEFKPLKKVASGGELSRIMLAIKSILSHYKKLPTLIFDEIDTGVSGQVSDRVAEVMSALSKNLQVFTITHLPQVAAKGEHHLKVEKTTTEGKTYTRLRPLNSAERIQEIAVMLSGNQVTPTAVAHAKQLMN